MALQKLLFSLAPAVLAGFHSTPPPFGAAVTLRGLEDKLSTILTRRGAREEKTPDASAAVEKNKLLELHVEDAVLEKRRPVPQGFKDAIARLRTAIEASGLVAAPADLLRSECKELFSIEDRNALWSSVVQPFFNADSEDSKALLAYLTRPFDKNDFHADSGALLLDEEHDREELWFYRFMYVLNDDDKRVRTPTSFTIPWRPLGLANDEAPLSLGPLHSDAAKKPTFYNSGSPRGIFASSLKDNEVHVKRCPSRDIYRLRHLVNGIDLLSATDHYANLFKADVRAGREEEGSSEEEESGQQDIGQGDVLFYPDPAANVREINDILKCSRNFVVIQNEKDDHASLLVLILGKKRNSAGVEVGPKHVLAAVFVNSWTNGDYVPYTSYRFNDMALTEGYRLAVNPKTRDACAANKRVFDAVTRVDREVLDSNLRELRNTGSVCGDANKEDESIPDHVGAAATRAEEVVTDEDTVDLGFHKPLGERHSWLSRLGLGERVYATRQIPFIDCSQNLQTAATDLNCSLYSHTLGSGVTRMLEEDAGVREELLDVAGRSGAGEAELEGKLQEIFRERVKAHLPMYFSEDGSSLQGGSVRRSEADVREFHLKTRWDVSGERLSSWYEALREEDRAQREAEARKNLAETLERMV